ncbi:unnamed protein product [Calypogeia fissa]
MGVLSNPVRKEDLNRGDHIYSLGSALGYAHHGIYVADNKVIHFTRGRNDETGPASMFIDILLSSSRPASKNRKCPDCGLTGDSNGVVLSCLDCFLADCPLYRFQYGENTMSFLVRGGTCTLAEADPVNVVLHRAEYLYENGFGSYNLFHNNGEDFAIYCKTGLLAVDNGFIARSGQAVTFLGAPVAAVISSPLKFMVKNPWGMAAASAGVYFFYRYATDIGVRKDVVNIAVEDLAIHMDWGQLAQQAQKAQQLQTLSAVMCGRQRSL